jgi:hypothetical protein
MAISAPASRPAGAARARCSRAGVAIRLTCSITGEIFVLEPAVRTFSSVEKARQWLAASAG